MKYLIIEDNIVKSKEIISFLNECFEDMDYKLKESYSSGSIESLKTEYDFILLDMSMPTFDISTKEKGGQPRHFAGKEILIKMQMKGIKTPVIIITGFENFGEGKEQITLKTLNKQLNDLGSENFYGIVFYSIVEKNWQKELLEKIHKTTSKKD